MLLFFVYFFPCNNIAFIFNAFLTQIALFNIRINQRTFQKGLLLFQKNSIFIIEVIFFLLLLLFFTTRSPISDQAAWIFRSNICIWEICLIFSTTILLVLLLFCFKNIYFSIRLYWIGTFKFLKTTTWTSFLYIIRLLLLLNLVYVCICLYIWKGGRMRRNHFLRNIVVCFEKLIVNVWTSAFVVLF